MKTVQEADASLAHLLRATLEQETLISARDKKIAEVQEEYAARLESRAGEIARLEAALEAFYRAHPADDTKSYRLAHGVIGLRSPATPALVPLNKRWDWDKISAKVKRLWKARYFHAPKPPSLDKVKLKRELSAEQLAKCGLKLDDTESFYVELNRLMEAA